MERMPINSQSFERKSFLQREVELKKHEELREIEENFSKTETKMNESHSKLRIMEDKIRHVRRDYSDFIDNNQAGLINQKKLLKEVSNYLQANDDNFVIDERIKFDDLKEAFSMISIALDKKKSADAVLKMQQEVERRWENIGQEINNIGNKIIHLKENFTLNFNEETEFNRYVTTKEKLLNQLADQRKQYGFYITDKAIKDINKIKVYYKQSTLNSSDYAIVNDWLFNSGDFNGRNPRQGKDKI